MPELPEVETVARTLAPHLVTATFTSVSLLRPATLHPQSLPLETLIGRQINNVSRRGKLLIIELEGASDSSGSDPGSLIAHLRMTGRFLTASPETSAHKHSRCIFDLKMPEGTEKKLFFDDVRAFGHLMVANPAVLNGWKFWIDLGPEPLLLSAADFYPRLMGKRNIKSALLDQKIIAGIGNIYADESLFAAKIRPDRECDSITEAESISLLQALKKILNSAIENRGSSIRDYRDADGQSGNFQTKFKVYGRGGQECKNCGALLKKIRVGGRSTVFCENCQS